MANEQNLIPNSKRSPEEVRANQRKGGINSGKARREKADLRKALQMWLQSDSGVRDKNGEMLTGTGLMTAVAVKEMAKGNPKYWELIRDTAGFKPVDKVMIADVDPAVISEVDSIVKGCLNDSEDET